MYLCSWELLTAVSQFTAMNYRYVPLQSNKNLCCTEVVRATTPHAHSYLLPQHPIPPLVFLWSTPCFSPLQATELLAWGTGKETGMNTQKLAKTVLFCNSINGRLQNYFYSRKNKTKQSLMSQAEPSRLVKLTKCKSGKAFCSRNTWGGLKSLTAASKGTWLYITKKCYMHYECWLKKKLSMVFKKGFFHWKYKGSNRQEQFVLQS